MHLYVAKAWVDGWFEGAEINHKDYDRNNYHADNLEWVTHKDNVDYSVAAGHYAEKDGLKNSNCRPMAITNIKDGTRLEFDYIYECAKYFKETFNLKSKITGIYSGIRKAFLLNHPYRGYTIEYL